MHSSGQGGSHSHGGGSLPRHSTQMDVSLVVESPSVLEDVGWRDDGALDVVDGDDLEKPHLELSFLRQSSARSLSLTLMRKVDVDDSSEQCPS